jgi:DNA-binding CsgD family transcriptional regulator
MLPEIRVPTQVIGARMGSSSAFIEGAKRAAVLIPGAQLALFENWPHHVYPTDDSLPPVIPVIEEFVRNLPLDTATSPTPVALNALSTREIEVLRLLAAGRSNQQIADELVISLNTVRRHVSNIFDKTGATNRVEAATYARDHGLV